MGILAVLTAVAAAPARADVPLFGYNDNTTLNGQFTPERDAQLLSRAGATSMRIVVDWTWVERQRGQLDLSLYDPIYKAMTDRGIRPLLNVMGAPRWAWQKWTICLDGEHCHVAPDRSYDWAWANFVGAVARRFPDAAAIEVWNEPNLRFFFRPAPNAGRYTELLRIARDAVKQAAPDLPVLGGALSPVMRPDNGAVTTRRFLADMYAAGARGLMDGVSIHPYPADRRWAGIYDAIDATIETRDTAGDTAPLWLTEVGASTTNSFYTETSQAIMLGDAVTRLMRRPGVRGVYLHTLADPQRTGFGAEDGYGILYRDADPKPAFCSITAALGDASCEGPEAGPRTLARWQAQERLQRAAEGALAWRRQTGGYPGFAPQSLPPDITAPPGPDADPDRVAVLPVAARADAIRLCNSSTDTRSYCMTLVPGGPWDFTSTDGSIAETARATDARTAGSW